MQKLLATHLEARSRCRGVRGRAPGSPSSSRQISAASSRSLRASRIARLIGRRRPRPRPLGRRRRAAARKLGRSLTRSSGIESPASPGSPAALLRPAASSAARSLGVLLAADGQVLERPGSPRAARSAPGWPGSSAVAAARSSPCGSRTRWSGRPSHAVPSARRRDGHGAVGEVLEQLHDVRDVVVGRSTPSGISRRLSPRLFRMRQPGLGGVDELDLALAVGRLAVGQHPDVGADARVVEELLAAARSMASSQSFSRIQRRISLSPRPASPVNSGEPFMTMATRLAALARVASSGRACAGGRGAGRR